MIDSPSFLKFLRSAPNVTEEEVARMASYFTSWHVKAKTHIVSEGEICKQIAYVEKGCFSYYKILNNGKKSIIHFAFEDWWTGDLQSFLNKQPATTYWQAIEDSDLIRITRNHFDLLTEQCPAFKFLFQKKTQTNYLRTLERSAKDKAETAEEKYLRMMEEYPQILQRIPHYDIAAYLGIAPESLSRIRNKLTKAK